MKKPVVIEARRCRDTELVYTAHGRVRAEPGDWVLKNPATGDVWPIKHDIFIATYVLVDETKLSAEETVASSGNA